MSDLDDLMTGTGGPPIEFNGPGSTVEGTLNSIGEWKDIPTKFGVKIKKPFNLTIDDEDRTLWVRKNSRLGTVIGQAFKDAGLSSLTVGGVLKVQRVADVPTDKGNDMHDYRAKYTPAVTAPIGLGDLEEAF